MIQQGKTVKIICISDTHTKHYDMQPLPEADILIHAGDFTYSGLAKEIQSFCNWLDKQTQIKHKIVIAGNHDVTLDEDLYECQHQKRFHRFSKPEDPKRNKELLKNSCIYLENESVNIMGINIYGSPYSPEFCQWAFSIEPGKQSDEMWQSIPDGTDILVTHGPPLNILDATKFGQHVGCKWLAQEIQKRVKPKYHIFGHIHEAYGIVSQNGTTYINCSINTYNYRPTNKPIQIEFNRIID